MKLTGAQILWECLVREGVTEIFGYPGGAILGASAWPSRPPALARPTW
jgi:thiamine pyrophosphate-dependent acetolactate synthase large subunit-like protein